MVRVEKDGLSDYDIALIILSSIGLTVFLVVVVCLICKASKAGPEQVNWENVEADSMKGNM